MKSPKILYLESKLKNIEKLVLPKSEISKLPKKLFLAYSIQYKELSYNIAKQLKKQKIQIQKTQQVLGCSKVNTKLPILLIGTGRFHAINLYLQAPEVYTLENNKIIQISKQEIEKLKAKRKTALMKFLKAENIGILVSTKPGQKNLQNATKLKNKLKKKGKQPYIFISNNIDITQFENFQIDSWVNTACPGLAFDNPNIINLDELPE